MRSISFMLTKRQFLDRSKTVTRRLGWWDVKPGQRLRAVEKSMGLAKGQRQVGLGVIEIKSTRAEILNTIDQSEVIREGFPDLTPEQFVEFFVRSAACAPDATVNRIEFTILETWGEPRWMNPEVAESFHLSS